MIQAIIELAEHAAKEPWTLPEPTRGGGGAQGPRRRAGPRRPLAEAYKETQKQARYEKVGAAKKQAAEALVAEGLEADKAKGLFKDLEADIVRNAILDTGPAHRRARHQDGAADRGRGRRAAARAWLRAVHPRRDAGARASPRSAPARTSR